MYIITFLVHSLSVGVPFYMYLDLAAVCDCGTPWTFLLISLMNLIVK